GIGKAIAVQFLKENANVTVVGRSKESLEALQRKYEEIQYIQANVSELAGRKRIEDVYKAKNKRIDVLINNVGGSNGGLFEETEVDLFYEAFEFNFFS